MTMTAAPVDFRLAQRRTISVLFAGAIFSRGAFSLGFAVAVLLIEDMLGSSRWAGLSTVAVTLGTVIAARELTKLMNRSGRRPGLTTGYGVGAVGAMLALIGAQQSWILLFLFGLVLVGVSAGASNLARYAAADLAAGSAKAKAISFIVFASTIGAVGGPAVVSLPDRLGQRLGLDPNVGPYGLAALLLAIGTVVMFLGLRPDPLALIGGLQTRESQRQGGGFARTWSLMGSNPMVRLAVVSLVVSQAVMVGVMAMTPLHMRAYDHDLTTIGFVISAHTTGMYAFAPLAGWASDRYGQVRAILFAALVLMLATTLTAFAGEAPTLLMFPGLYLLGLGWSFGFVAGSALLSGSVSDEDRVSVQGAADLLAGVVSGVAALVSGLILDMAGFHILSAIGILAGGLLLVTAFRREREPSPLGA